MALRMPVRMGVERVAGVLEPFQEPGLVDEIYLDVDPHTGIRPGERWKEALNKASTRCEAVICLLSQHWLNSAECNVEFRYAENLHKAILCARLEPVSDDNITSEWQRCDLFPSHDPITEVDSADGGEPVVLDRVGLQQLLSGLHSLGIAAQHFPWPPPDDPTVLRIGGGHHWRRPTPRCFSGATPQFCAAWTCCAGWFRRGRSPCSSSSDRREWGKSSFLRAGLLPRPDDGPLLTVLREMVNLIKIAEVAAAAFHVAFSPGLSVG
jgi:hypothetical protein